MTTPFLFSRGVFSTASSSFLRQDKTVTLAPEMRRIPRPRFLVIPDVADVLLGGQQWENGKPLRARRRRVAILAVGPPPLTAHGHTAIKAGPGLSGCTGVKSPADRQAAWKGKALYTRSAGSKGKARVQRYQHIWLVGRPSSTATTTGSTPATCAGSSWP